MLIRPFDGSRRDAEGLLAVDRGTFAESPYNADQVIHLLTRGEQRAWLALVEGEVTGFVTVFPTHTLYGRNWEVDLVAVQPASQGQGIATELIKELSPRPVSLQTRQSAICSSTKSGDSHPARWILAL
jgi:GNAT superfamily N-acetyltransferase